MPNRMLGLVSAFLLSLLQSCFVFHAIFQTRVSSGHTSPAEISLGTTLQALVAALDSIRDPLVSYSPTGYTLSSIRPGGCPPLVASSPPAGALSRFYIRPGRPWHKIPKLC
ncbi:hypothetical protein F4678DRAFT_75141 [Xylaria arbuscula]|nr:hypothetical protein F4678DRAFT_75141 [Xylaria arbuscula]